MFFAKAQLQDEVETWKEVMDTVQIVDSAYALNRLAEKMNVGAFLKSYRFCLEFDMKSGAGSFFERVIHQTVKNRMPKPVNDVCWSKGNTDASLQQLFDTGVYWIPSISNFASIDSALVHKHTLCSCQMTIAEKREFNVTSFRNSRTR
jgi:hypothetical protein